MSEVVELGRPFMYMTNSRGASTDPWGIPDVTGFHSELLPFIITFCVRSVR